ncbi:MaoC family dehydratase [Pseudonocardia sp. RS11V-5]|uniref:MaoC family dehydratase n=1 Tax=Pseudonocardia terrae TaxID=2905831 RepID=UPI001E495420|nr:MaoC family dehydratase [Pseudonocardia terrae]MCE3551099.1 MaoC family dehydratase [Pseudonocardia terrae]
MGEKLGTSEWLTVEQSHIDLFAETTGDHQWINVDPARAAEGQFGTTIVHGFLTLSLLPVLAASTYEVGKKRMGINYGPTKIRLTAPVPAGSRVRATAELVAAEAPPCTERHGAAWPGVSPIQISQRSTAAGTRRTA